MSRQAATSSSDVHEILGPRVMVFLNERAKRAGCASWQDCLLEIIEADLATWTKLKPVIAKLDRPVPIRERGQKAAASRATNRKLSKDERAMEVQKILHLLGQELGVAEICERMSVSRSKVQRVAHEFEKSRHVATSHAGVNAGRGRETRYYREVLCAR